MKFDLIIGGVGGQGILSIAFVIDNSALKSGLYFKQSEVHGMAQRGGAVSSHLRIGSDPIFSDLVALGSAEMLMAVEPMEALRYKDYLKRGGIVVSNIVPVINIPEYPEHKDLISGLLSFQKLVLINADKIAKEASSPRAQNMAILGAASPYLPLRQEIMEEFIGILFSDKGDKLIQINLNAFRFGLANGRFFTACLEKRSDPTSVLELMDHLDSGAMKAESASAWSKVLSSPIASELSALFQSDPKRLFPSDPETANRIFIEGIKFLRENL